MAARGRRGARAVAAVAATVLVLAGATACASRDGDDPSTVVTAPPTTDLHEPTMTITEGEPVRGTAVTARLDGLVALRGLDVDVTIETDGPVHTTSGGDRVGALGVASSSVDRSGAALVDFVVPNALSGEDDVIPLVPGERYLLAVTARDPSGHDAATIPFEVAAAHPDTPYPVSARRGATECGAPPIEVDFDGVVWAPDDPSRFPAGADTFRGTFAVSDDRAGRFVAADGATTTFTVTAGYSC